MRPPRGLSQTPTHKVNSMDVGGTDRRPTSPFVRRRSLSLPRHVFGGESFVTCFTNRPRPAHEPEGVYIRARKPTGTAPTPWMASSAFVAPGDGALSLHRGREPRRDLMLLQASTGKACQESHTERSIPHVRQRCRARVQPPRIVVGSAQMAHGGGEHLNGPHRREGHPGAVADDRHI